MSHIIWDSSPFLKDETRKGQPEGAFRTSTGLSRSFEPHEGKFVKLSLAMSIIIEPHGGAKPPF